jgi:hypothetical protein
MGFPSTFLHSANEKLFLCKFEFACQNQKTQEKRSKMEPKLMSSLLLGVNLLPRSICSFVHTVHERSFPTHVYWRMNKRTTQRRVVKKGTKIISVSMLVYQLIYFKRGRRVLGLEHLRICDCVGTGKLCVHFTVKNEKIKFSSYIRKFRRDRAQSHIRGRTC